MVIPPAAFLGLLAVPSLSIGTGRSSRSGTSSSRGGRSGIGGCARRCNNHSGLSSTPIVCMFRCAVVGGAICLVPGHDLLVLRGIRTEGIADSARGRVEALEVSRLAEAGPSVLVCARDAIASLGSLVEGGT